MFTVSPPGIHISLGICVWGYTYHGDTHITVTPCWCPFVVGLSLFSSQLDPALVSVSLVLLTPRGIVGQPGDIRQYNFLLPSKKKTLEKV